MSEMEAHSSDAAELRRRAEEMDRGEAAQWPENLEGLSPAETWRTLQELRVHQIELEMQNDELRRRQAELDASRARYFELYDLARVGYCTVSQQGLILEANLTAAGLLGVARGALATQRLTSFILREDKDLYYLYRRQLFETGEPQGCELRMVKKGGTAFWVRLEGTAAEDAGGAPVCRVVMSDITERKQAGETLRQAHAELTAIYASVPVALLLVDRDLRVIKWNTAVAQFAARIGEDMLDLRSGEALRCLHSLDDPRGCGFGTSCSWCPIRLAVTDTFADRNGRDQLEVLLSIGAGQGAEDRWLLVSTAYLESNGAGQVLISAHDITERKRAEETLRESVSKMELAVQEKTVLLQEIHHRVKNNLAVTASLLSMKADGCGPEARLALEESLQRVHSIALVHECLYDNDRLDRINFGKYARRLVQGIYSTFGGEHRRIGLDLELDPIELSIDRAVPCALILNELLSNAFKYAFADGRTGRILVSFRQPEPACYELAVEDDGIGLPAGALGGQNKSLGLRIVRILTNQLDGSVEQKACSGTRIVLRLPAAA